MARAYLSLGSNMGNRKAHLKTALKFLKEHKDIKVKETSAVYESEPVGGVSQRNFYNMVLEVETTLSPPNLLEVCQLIEETLKRERKVRWGPRTIDVDILLYDSQRTNLEELVIPHPEMKKRAFVLLPLLEIAPKAKLPSGELLRDYLSALPVTSYPSKIGNLKL